MSVVGNVTELIRFREAGEGGSGGARVVLITEGRGNKRDRNAYPAEMLQKSFPVFEGTKCFLDHPSYSEEKDRPERSVRDQCGWFSDVRLEEIAGMLAVTGKLNTSQNSAGREAKESVSSEIDYQNQYPDADSVFVGLSINAEGPGHPEDLDGDGNTWNVVEEIVRATSVDLVTFPARGGKILGFREAEDAFRSSRWRRRFDEVVAG